MQERLLSAERERSQIQDALVAGQSEQIEKQDEILRRLGVAMGYVGSSVDSQPKYAGSRSRRVWATPRPCGEVFLLSDPSRRSQVTRVHGSQ